jgi:PEP-CTERM motif
MRHFYIDHKNMMSSLLFVSASLFITTANAAVVNIEQRLNLPITYTGNILESYFNINTAFAAGDTVVLNYRFGDDYTAHVSNPNLVLAEAWDSAFAGQLSTSGATLDFIGANGAVLHSSMAGTTTTRLAGQFENFAAGTYTFSSIRAQFQVSGISSSTYAPRYGYFALAGNNINFSAPTPVPEPESYALLLAGLGGLGLFARHKNRGLN